MKASSEDWFLPLCSIPRNNIIFSFFLHFQVEFGVFLSSFSPCLFYLLKKIQVPQSQPKTDYNSCWNQRVFCFVEGSMIRSTNFSLWQVFSFSLTMGSNRKRKKVREENMNLMSVVTTLLQQLYGEKMSHNLHCITMSRQTWCHCVLKGVGVGKSFQQYFKGLLKWLIRFIHVIYYLQERNSVSMKYIWKGWQCFLMLQVLCC